MGTVVFVLLLALAFFVISVFLFKGKGSWLIAGYNTASVEVRAKYNEKKLCQTVGFVTLTVSVLLCIMAYLGFMVEKGRMQENQLLPYAIFFIVSVILSIVVASIYVDKKCLNE